MDQISDLLPSAIPMRPSSTQNADRSGAIQIPETLCPCPDCGGVGWFKLDLDPCHADFGKIVRCPNEVHQPAYIERLARLSGLVREDLDIRLTDFREVHYMEKRKVADDQGQAPFLVSNRAMLEVAYAFVKEPYGFVYIWGNVGNAKSDALIAIVNQINLAAGQVVAVYLKFSKLVEYMREAYIENEKRKTHPEAPPTYSQRFDEIKHVKVLCIDEFDFDGEKQRETAFAREFRFDFLDDRYHLGTRGQVATVFASNSPPENLPEPIYDRMRDGRFQIVHNTAPSARPAMKRQAA